eukprot:COSAG06_NODE_4663_length_4054_cov_20.799494_3_plen_55_part_00
MRLREDRCWPAVFAPRAGSLVLGGGLPLDVRAAGLDPQLQVGGGLTVSCVSSIS